MSGPRDRYHICIYFESGDSDFVETASKKQVAFEIAQFQANRPSVKYAQVFDTMAHKYNRFWWRIKRRNET